MREELIIRYIGTRPFKQSAEDLPVMPGDLIDEYHQYAAIREALLTRVDFERVDDDG